MRIPRAAVSLNEDTQAVRCVGVIAGRFGAEAMELTAPSANEYMSGSK